MLLSEAIRIGASWSKQTRGTLKHLTDKSTCALGSAYEGCFGEINVADILGSKVTVKIMLQNLANKFPYLKSSVLCPVNHSTLPLLSIIIFLNDAAFWTREMIANWVESLEKQNGWTGSTPEIKEAEVKSDAIH